jgi:cytochrome c2
MKFSRKSGLVFWTIWHSIAALALVLIPGLLILRKSAGSLSDGEAIFLAGIALSYLTCALILTWQSRNGRAIPLRDLILVILAVFGVYYFLLLLSGSYFSRPVLLFTFVCAAILILMSLSFTSSLQKTVIITIFLLTLSMQFMADQIVRQLTGVPGPQRSQKLINTEFYNVSAFVYKNFIDGCPGSDDRCGPSETSGGGISILGDGYLLSSGQGDLFFLKLNDDTHELESSLLATRIPLNTDSFRSDNGEVDVWLFRVTDILVQEEGDKFRLFAAYNHWKSDQQCSVLRISSLEGDYASFLSGDAGEGWQTIFDSEPCLPITKGRRGDRFKGADSGGRMVLLDDNRLLFSIGDYQVDGWNREDILAQDNNVDYGKTVLIDLDTGSSRIYSSGHRNPQGLYAGTDGAVWLTEHGPRGGDELNLVLENANYGWPNVTYGTEYGEKRWPLSNQQGQHEGYRRPVFAWIPSIAVSNVIAVENDRFPLWEGDLLVASYKQSLWRLRLREGRVIYSEPVQVLKKSGRIRDLMEDQQGRIVLWLDGGSIAILEPLDETEPVSDEFSGQVLYVQCAGCHNIRTGGGHPRDSKVPGIGPDLLCMVDSAIAASPGYSYTDALKNIPGSWSIENLDRFLKDPQGFAPGTKMEFTGVKDDEKRKKLIQYLQTLK